MRRWNGWGDVSVEAHLATGAQQMLHELVGQGNPANDAALDQVIAQVPPSKLPEHRLVSHDAETRLRHARGQSLPDWVALRSGQIPAFPDGVAFPTNHNEVAEIMAFAQSTGARVIPYGGGTSVVGHLTPPKGDPPVLTVSMARLNGLLELDKRNHLARFGAGVAGPDLENTLRAEGFTLGHFPQSFEYATLGGWVVTRSSGQQSLGYGRIEDLFAGGRLISPAGELEMPTLPASAAGPDLRQLVLGSEGRMGIVTEAVVRVRPIPEREFFHAVFFPDWDRAENAVRALAQAGLPLSMMRLSNAVETQTNLILAGKERLIAYLKKFLGWRGVDDEGCMLLIGFTGMKPMVRKARARALEICRDFKGVHVFQALGKAWSKNRFKAPYLRNALWDMGYAVDTLETCVHWSHVRSTMNQIEQSIHQALEPWEEQAHVFTHLSHFYSGGASVYTTYLFRLADTPEATLERWRAMKSTACKAIVANHGTISHQHGVGEDHKPWLEAEKSALGIDLIRHNCQFFDPDAIMNPGKLV